MEPPNLLDLYAVGEAFLPGLMAPIVWLYILRRSLVWGKPSAETSRAHSPAKNMESWQIPNWMKPW